MKDLPIIWLLLNTTIGRIVIGLFVVFVVVSIFGWWLVPSCDRGDPCHTYDDEGWD